MAWRWISMLLILCLLLGTMTTMGFAAEEPTTEAPTGDPTEGTTEAPTDDPTEGTTEAPTEEPTEESTEPPLTGGSCGDTMNWGFDVASGKLIISGSGAMDEFDVQPWGAWTTQITSIEFGADIRSVSKYAFSGCTAVKKIRFQGPVPGTIGSNAFKGISATVYYPGLDPSWASMEKKNYGGALTWSPEVPGGKGGVFGNNFAWHLEGSTLKIVGKGNMSGWQSGVENPPWYAYRNDVKKVVMSGSIYSIYTSSFRDMPNLTEIDWPDDLNIIYSSAFYNCTGLTKLDIPNSVTTISDYAFYGCENLSEVDLPSQLKELGRNAFTNCKSLASISLPDRLESLGQKAFSYSGIQNVIIPQKVTKIRTSTFQGCKSLQSVTFMGNVTEIGQECFESCLKLTALELPASLKTIGEGAFANSGLKEVIFGGKMPTISAEAFDGVKAAVFYPADDASWEATRLQALEKTYAKNLTFYAGTPDSIVEETEAPTEAPTEPPTEAPTEAPTEPPTEVPTEAPTEAPSEVPTEPVVTEPAITEPATEAPTQPPVVQEPAEEMSLLDYWPVAVAAVWFFGGGALAVYLLLIRPRRRR